MSSQLLEQVFELVPIGKLQPHPDNPRKGSVDGIAKSIAANGFYRPVVVQKSTSRILAGNHSWQAAQAEGLKKIPVVWIDCDDAAALKILLADNKLSDDATYDEMALAQILIEARAAGNLEGTGYTDVDLAELFKSMGDEILKAAEPENPKDLGGTIDEQFQILIQCESETQQVELLEKFEAEGYDCRALVS